MPPLTRLTLEERIRLVRFSSLYEKASTIQKAWVKEFGTAPPSRKTITALNKKFDETGSVADLTRSGRPKTSRTEETIALVQNAIRDDPTKSIRILSNELGLNKASVHRIKQDSEKQSFLKQENKKLKEKINEMQRRLDILEGRKPGSRMAKLNGRKEPLVINFNDEEDLKPMPFLVSRTSNILPHFQQNIELLGVEEGQRLAVQHGLGGSTVITVLTNHTLELTTDGQQVHHLTIDEDGHLQEVEQGDLHCTQEMLTQLAEIESIHNQGMEGEMLEGDEMGIIEEQDLISQHQVVVETDEGISTELEHGGNEEVHVGSEEVEIPQEIMADDDIPKYHLVQGTLDGDEMTDCSSMEIPICFITSSHSQ